MTLQTTEVEVWANSDLEKAYERIKALEQENNQLRTLVIRHRAFINDHFGNLRLEADKAKRLLFDDEKDVAAAAAASVVGESGYDFTSSISSLPKTGFTYNNKFYVVTSEQDKKLRSNQASVILSTMLSVIAQELEFEPNVYSYCIPGKKPSDRKPLLETQIESICSAAKNEFYFFRDREIKYIRGKLSEALVQFHKKRVNKSHKNKEEESSTSLSPEKKRAREETEEEEVFELASPDKKRRKEENDQLEQTETQKLE